MAGATRPKRRALQDSLLVWWDKYIFLTFGIVLLHQQNQVTVESGKDVNFWTTFLLLPIGFGSLKDFGRKV